jgi:quercetin dioxygenase-like cupin family protein
MIIALLLWALLSMLPEAAAAEEAVVGPSQMIASAQAGVASAEGSPSAPSAQPSAPSAPAAPPMIVTPREEARFVPMDPKRPDVGQQAVLWGDPATGPSTMLMRFGRSSGKFHLHSSDYHLIVLEGTMKHWGAGESEATAKELRPGSYWYQPGNIAHADSCLSESCLMYVQWSGRSDSRPAPMPPSKRDQ